MSMPFYVSPEQVMKDRAEYAQKGIARGKSLISIICTDGVLLAAENPSKSLHKIGEIHDRIAFAGVGKFNEFDQLRVAGIRHADIKGYTYSREDVDARSLANLYAQYLGQVFTHEMKPLEIEVLVAKLGIEDEPSQLFQVSYDGTVVDQEHYVILGGEAQQLHERASEVLLEKLPLDESLPIAVGILQGTERVLTSDDLEVAVLKDKGQRRTFYRYELSQTLDILGR
jgi:proteasome alpha subunit